MSKKVTIVLQVSDDTAEKMQEWGESDHVLFMGTATRLLELKIEPVMATSQVAITTRLLELKIEPVMATSQVAIITCQRHLKTLGANVDFHQDGTPCAGQ